MTRAALAALLLVVAPLAQAHKASDAYVTLHVDGATVDARIDIALRDLDRDLGLDTNADDQLSWKEVHTRWGDIAALARSDIHLSADGARCTPDAASAPLTDANRPALTEHSDGTYAVLRMQWHCAAPVQALSVDYDLFAKTDPTHRGIARVSRTDVSAGGIAQPSSDDVSAKGVAQPSSTAVPAGGIAQPSSTDVSAGGIAHASRAGDAATATAPQLAVLSPGHGWHRFRLPPLPPLAATRPATATATATADASATAIADAATATADATAASADVVQTPATADAAAAAAPPRVQADVDAASTDDTPTSSFLGFVREGVHHILIGYDHILFLLSLLLPAVWIRSAVTDPRTGVTRTRWVPSNNLRLALANVLKVVTAFTVAHSITLALSVLDVVNPPSRWVESIIAASVVLAALNNIWPLISEARWKLTFVFGLVHGFGFASALKDAGLAKGALAAPLVGFNVGVEIGQLCIVAVVLPIAWSLRDTRTYRGAFAGGSLAIAAVAGLWLIQRAFDLSLIAG